MHRDPSRQRRAFEGAQNFRHGLRVPRLCISHLQDGAHVLSQSSRRSIIMDFGTEHAHIFAVLIPLSDLARNVTMYNRNSMFSDYVANILPVSDPMIRQHQHQRLTKLSFAATMGRQCITFGSSRLNDFQIPMPDAVSHLHFTLFFDHMEHGLHMRNTSHHGTWVTAGSGELEAMTRIDSTPLPVPPVTHIRFGSDESLRWLLILNLPAAPDSFHMHLADYFQSLEPSPVVTSSTLAQASQRQRPTREMEDSTHCKRQCMGF